MKILQVIPYFAPHFGGDVNSCKNLSIELAHRGHEVTIITTNFEFNNEFAKTVEKEGVRVIAFNCIANISMFLISPGINLWLDKNTMDFDVIHLHNFRSYQNSVVHHYAIKYKIPYVLQARGDLQYFQKRNLKRLFDKVWGNRLLEDAAKLIALTNSELEEHKLWGIEEGRVSIIPNWIDLSLYNDLPLKNTFRKKFKIPARYKIILYLGRINRIKGLDLLIDAYADLVSEVDDIQLVITGPDDGFLTQLKEKVDNLGISKDVVFTGPLFGRDKLEAYVDADSYVLPSIYEAFPNTILEAYACHTPAIITDKCGIANCFSNSVIVVSFNKSQLKNAIYRMLNDSALRSKLVREGLSLIEKEFEKNRVIGKLEDTYIECSNEYS